MDINELVAIANAMTNGTGELAFKPLKSLLSVRNTVALALSARDAFSAAGLAGAGQMESTPDDANKDYTIFGAPSADVKAWPVSPTKVKTKLTLAKVSRPGRAAERSC